MKLCYMPGACSFASHIVLNWIGEPYELRRIERESLHMPDYLKVNPLGKVPALIEDDGRVLTESPAILLYLAEKYPDKDLGHIYDPQDRYELHHWLSHLGGNFHPAFFPFFMPDRYSSDPGQHSAVKQAALGQIRKQLEFLELYMTDRDHVVGEQRSVVDPYLFVMLRWAKNCSPDWKICLNLHSFYDKVKLDPGVQQAAKKEGIEL